MKCVDLFCKHSRINFKATITIHKMLLLQVVVLIVLLDVLSKKTVFQIYQWLNVNEFQVKCIHISITAIAYTYFLSHNSSEFSEFESRSHNVLNWIHVNYTCWISKRTNENFATQKFPRKNSEFKMKIFKFARKFHTFLFEKMNLN